MKVQVRPMILSARAVQGDTERVVRHIQKICKRHFKSTLKPGSVLTGIMPCETCLCVFKSALNTVVGPKTTLGTGHKKLRHSPRAEIPSQRCHPSQNAIFCTAPPFRSRGSVWSGFSVRVCHGQNSVDISQWSVAYTTNEDSRQRLLILSRACGNRRVSRGQECTTRPKHRSALAKGAPASTGCSV